MKCDNVYDGESYFRTRLAQYACTDLAVELDSWTGATALLDVVEKALRVWRENARPGAAVLGELAW